MKVFDKPLAFIDTETTGLDPAVHEIIEIAIIKDSPLSETDPTKKANTERFETIVRPRDMNVADPAAMLVNGITAEELEGEGAVPFEEMAEALNDILKDCIIVGKNVAFDLDFLRAAYKQVRADTGKDVFIEFGKDHLDIMPLAYMHLGPLGLSTLSLKSICEFLGEENSRKHRAMGDAAATRACFYQLINWTPIAEEEGTGLMEKADEYVAAIKASGFGTVSAEEAMTVMAYEVLRDPGVKWLREITGGEEGGLANKWLQSVAFLRNTRVVE